MSTGRPLLVAATCVAVGIDQLCYYIDLLAYISVGKWPIGAAKYLIRPDTR